MNWSSEINNDLPILYADRELNGAFIVRCEFPLWEVSKSAAKSCSIEQIAHQLITFLNLLNALRLIFFVEWLDSVM